MNCRERFLYIIFSLFTLLIPSSLNAQKMECEDSCRHVHGIDVSHYQNTIDWEVIGDNSHLAYVYIKASEGGDRIDDRFEDNIRLAHQYGLKVGSYHFYRPKIDQELQLRNFVSQCRPSEQDLIPMIDVETSSGLSTEAFCDSLFKFLELVEQVYRQRPLIYTGTNFYNRHFQGKLDRYLLMIAQYSEDEPVLADERDVTLWQYTGKGRVDGVKGYVDKSRFMGRHSLRELRFKHRSNER